jgi:hypothetical protein
MALRCFESRGTRRGRDRPNIMEQRSRMRRLSARGFVEPVRVLIMGHSFVKWLERYVRRDMGMFHNFNFEYNVSEVFMYGVGGRKAKECRYHDLKIVEEVKPRIVFIEMGSNDLCDPDAKPEVIASDILDLCQDILKLGVSKVVVGQIVERCGQGIPRSVPNYNFKVAIVNQVLEALLDTDGCRFWKHFGFYRAEEINREYDGVHLSERANKKLFRSIRGALLQEIRAINDAVPARTRRCLRRA